MGLYDFGTKLSADKAVLIDVSAADQTLAAGCWALYVGVAGDIKVDLPNAAGITVKNAAVGYHPIEVTKVYKTGTTASSVLALY